MRKNNRKRDVQWVKDKNGKWEHMQKGDRRLRHEMETTNRRKKS